MIEPPLPIIPSPCHCGHSQTVPRWLHDVAVFNMIVPALSATASPTTDPGPCGERRAILLDLVYAGPRRIAVSKRLYDVPVPLPSAIALSRHCRHAKIYRYTAPELRSCMKRVHRTPLPSPRARPPLSHPPPFSLRRSGRAANAYRSKSFPLGSCIP